MTREGTTAAPGRAGSSAPAVDYRARARHHADCARVLLNTADARSSTYAALELRMALEALVYEIAQSFSDDMPADRAAWQPPQLLRRLLEIDAGADSAHELQVQLPAADGTSGEDWVSLGKEKRLSLKTIGEHYGALGSYLHTPTLASLQKGKEHDVERLRKRSRELLALIDEVLASTLWNLNFNAMSDISCQGCGSTIKRRMNRLEGGPGERLTELFIDCFECAASYRVTREPDGHRWEPLSFTAPCQHDGCGKHVRIWRRQVDYGNLIRCDACGHDLRFDVLVSNGDADPPRRLPFTPPWIEPVSGRREPDDA